MQLIIFLLLSLLSWKLNLDLFRLEGFYFSSVGLLGNALGISMLLNAEVESNQVGSCSNKSLVKLIIRVEGNSIWEALGA